MGAAASVDVALQEKNQLKTLNIFVKMTSRILSLISLTIVVLIFTIDGGPPVVQAHGHSHDAEPNPAFKYSRAANEKIQEDEIQDMDTVMEDMDTATVDTDTAMADTAIAMEDMDTVMEDTAITMDMVMFSLN